MRTTVFLTASALAWCCACGGEEPAPSPMSPAPTLERVQALVFTPGCASAGCHDAGAPLDLSSTAASAAALVMKKATNAVAHENAWMLVKPGEPERSFLVRKLVGPGVGEGGPMPSSTQQLAPYYLDLVTEWIAEGAQP